MAKNKNNKTNAERLREEFYKGMAELKERQERTDAQIAEIGVRIKELREAQKHTDAQIDKLLKAQEKTDAEIDKLLKAQEKTDKQMRETDERMKKTDERIAKREVEIDRLLKSQEKTDELVKELSKNVGGINNSLGKISEDMSIPQIERMFDKFKISIEGYYPDIRRKYNGRAKVKEVDLILVGTFNNKDIAIVVETKARYKKPKEIDNFNKFVSEEFKQIFKTYKNHGVIGCVCASGYGTGLEKYAEKLGLFVMKPTKDIMSIINRPDFKVKIV